MPLGSSPPRRGLCVWFFFDLPTLTPTPRHGPSAELPTYPEALTGLDAAELPTYPRAGGLGEELGQSPNFRALRDQPRGWARDR